MLAASVALCLARATRNVRRVCTAARTGISAWIGLLAAPKDLSALRAFTKGTVAAMTTGAPARCFRQKIAQPLGMIMCEKIVPRPAICVAASILKSGRCPMVNLSVNIIVCTDFVISLEIAHKLIARRPVDYAIRPMLILQRARSAEFYR